VGLVFALGDVARAKSQEMRVSRTHEFLTGVLVTPIFNNDELKKQGAHDSMKNFRGSFTNSVLEAIAQRDEDLGSLRKRKFSFDHISAAVPAVRFTYDPSNVLKSKAILQHTIASISKDFRKQTHIVSSIATTLGTDTFLHSAKANVYSERDVSVLMDTHGASVFEGRSGAVKFMIDKSVGTLIYLHENVSSRCDVLKSAYTVFNTALFAFSAPSIEQISMEVALSNSDVAVVTT